MIIDLFRISILGRHRMQQSINEYGKELLNKKVRILTHEEAEPEMIDHSRKFNEGKVIMMLKNANQESYPLALIDFENKISIKSKYSKSIDFPLRYVILSSRLDFPIETILRGNWVEVDIFALPLNKKSNIIEPFDPYISPFLKRMIHQMCYLAPEGEDPYLDDSYDCRILDIDNASPQQYGNEIIEKCYSLNVQLPNGMELQGYTRYDLLKEYKIDSIMKLKLELVQCKEVSHIHENSMSFIRKYDAGRYFTYEAQGTVCALWWPGGNCFSLAIDDLFIRIDDNLRKRNPEREISLGDKIHVIGDLEF